MALSNSDMHLLIHTLMALPGFESWNLTPLPPHLQQTLNNASPDELRSIIATALNQLISTSSD